MPWWFGAGLAMCVGELWAADCEFTALQPLGGVEVLTDWRSYTAPLSGFLAAGLALLALLRWRGRRRGGGLADSISVGFNAGPRQSLALGLLLLLVLVPIAYSGFALIPSDSGLRIDSVCYADLRLYRYPESGVARYNREWPASLQTVPASPPGAATEIVVPVGATVTFEVRNFYTDRDWWRRLLDVERQALPRSGEHLRLRFSREGEYRGFCRSVCPGVSAASPMTVRAVSMQAFQAWVEQAAQMQAERWAFADRESLLRDGERVYRRRCAACHGDDGQGSGAMFPGLRASAMLRGPVEGHVQFVWHGRPGSPMKAFSGELGIYEMAAVTTYQRNAWGLDSGDVIQAADIQAMLAAY